MTVPWPLGPGNVDSIADCDSVLRRVCLDTGFVWRAVDPIALDGGEAGAFLTHLDLAGADIFRSGFVDLEILDVAFGTLAEPSPRRGRGASVPDEALIAEWDKMRGSTAVHWVSIDEVTDDVEPLMRRYGLDSQRALHVATSIATESQAFVTTDPSYAVVDPELLPMLVDSGSVERARSLRGAATG